MTRCGRCTSTRLRAAGPSKACKTLWPSASSLVRIKLQRSTSSSTTRIAAITYSSLHKRFILYRRIIHRHSNTQQHTETAPLANLTLNSNRSSHSFDQVTHNSESQPKPTGCSRPRGIGTIETLKNALQVIIWNTNACICNNQCEIVTSALSTVIDTI